jgi:hypothetical protein
VYFIVIDRKIVLAIYLSANNENFVGLEEMALRDI